MKAEAGTGTPVVLIKAKLYRSLLMKAKECMAVLFVMCMEMACLIPLTKVCRLIKDKQNITPFFSPFMTVERVSKSIVNEL